ncbi:hypothetical protein M422DRAFT_263395 [Sphaerobolus stellatus SS14]|uniref:Alpha/beta hydrolase fold-3 domain-containing protein n=1 Tax=Sphaerobolus stellatus (strain SS14) TaxID=990650 RepID=A0A0C9VAF4_SPHS4|nr:hypothetical protein M422DRAFT_263395 [Sphaerobolus stellatus SS14]
MSYTYRPLHQERNSPNASRFDKAIIGVMFLFLPFALLSTTIRCTLYLERKEWKRAITERTAKLVTSSLNPSQFLLLSGTSRSVYEGWARKNGIRSRIDGLEDAQRIQGREPARLFWVGERKKGPQDQVILYIHGGWFNYPLSELAVSFWYDLQKQMEKKGKIVGVACLSYSPLPDAAFPIPLMQAVLAVKHLLSLGILPQNIHIAGDAAGANLVLQLFSHILHPLPGIPTLPPMKLGSIYLLSPWTVLTPPESSTRKDHNSTDVLTSHKLAEFGKEVLDSVSNDRAEEAAPYIEPGKAPKGWFTGIGLLMDRMLITSGTSECMVDEIGAFSDRIHFEILASTPANSISDNSSIPARKRVASFRYLAQPGGVHNDPFLDFMIPTEVRHRSKVNWVVNGWFEAGIV